MLAGTGKTGSRLAAKLAKLGVSVRTAARKGADVHFDWDDATSHWALLPRFPPLNRLSLPLPAFLGPSIGLAHASSAPKVCLADSD
jgi:hypothetical protein